MNLGGRLPSPSPLPWRRPRHELLLLVLVAAAALAVVLPTGAQDVSRMCLTRALVHLHVSADECLAGAVDQASHGGHLYSDKAPGVSALSVPAAAIVRLPPPSRFPSAGDLRLWAVRMSTGGIALILCAFLVGRVAEGLAPGWGGASLVTLALGTVASALAASSFGHVPAAALAFGAFVLAWSRRPFLAGLAAGLAVLVEYEAGLVALSIGVYVLLAGRQAAARYLLGLIPGLALLGAYDWAAFGSPFHLSYRYVAPEFAAEQSAGFFGVHVPTLHGLHLVFVGDRGLLVDSPVLVAAAFGLALLWRRGRRAEASLCAFVTCAFLVLNSGYFLPYGGDSPGPRFLIPALPFLAVGLALAYAARPVVTAVLAVASVVPSTAIALTWPAAANSGMGYRGSVWREIGEFVAHGSASPIASWTQSSLLTSAGLGRLGSAGIATGCAAAALAIGLGGGWSSRRRASKPTRLHSGA